MSAAPLPRVSIVTPSYNQARFLESTLRSVLAQQGPFELEYIVVDGASTDGSPEIIRRCEDRLAWWVSEPDRGQAEAVNKGLRRARGEIVAWLNSDDIYLPEAVAGAVRALEAEPELGMVYGDAVTIDAEGRPLKRLSFGDWGLEELMAFRVICQPAVFMRRPVLERAGYLDPGYHYMLDHHLWIRMARLAPIRHVPVIWAAARHHPGAKNVKAAAAFGEETLRILAWMQQQPDLGPSIAADRGRYWAGAQRLNARYLLDGGQPGPALRAYARALRGNPRFALQHWHRMIYALLSLAGLGKLAAPYYRLAGRRTGGRAALAGLSGLQGWPGLAEDGGRVD